MESNVTLIRNLIKENTKYKQVSEILKQSFPEVTRGFSERNVRLFCAKYGIRRLNEYEVDSIVQDCVNEVSLFLFLCFVSDCLNRGVPFLFRPLSLPPSPSNRKKGTFFAFLRRSLVTAKNVPFSHF